MRDQNGRFVSKKVAKQVKDADGRSVLQAAEEFKQELAVIIESCKDDKGNLDLIKVGESLIGYASTPQMALSFLKEILPYRTPKKSSVESTENKTTKLIVEISGFGQPALISEVMTEKLVEEIKDEELD